MRILPRFYYNFKRFYLYIRGQPDPAVLLRSQSSGLCSFITKVFILLGVSLFACACSVDFNPAPIPPVFGEIAAGELESVPVDGVAAAAGPPGTAELPVDAEQAFLQPPAEMTEMEPAALSEPGTLVPPAAAGLSPVFEQLTRETFLFIIPPGFNSCTNIAMMFGISLEAFYEANPQTRVDGRCLIHTGDVLQIPPIPILEPGTYVGMYDCVPSGKRVCLQPDSPPQLMIAHTLYGEGGSSFGPGSAANILQTALNRIRSLEQVRSFCAANLTEDEYARLLVHILAQPYGTDNPQAAYNAFAFAVDRPTGTSGPYAWQAALEMAGAVLEQRGQGTWWPPGFAPAAAIRDPVNSVTSYCSCPSDKPPFESAHRSRIVAFEEKNRLNGRSQWYYRNGLQFCSASCVQQEGS